MRLSDIVNLGKEYLIVGLCLAMLLGIGFILWYFLYFKKKRNGERLKWGRVVWAGVFLIYLVVVFGATMLSRGNFYGNEKIYPLFYSYKDAWNDFSMTEWRNIILNILMFVPLGILVPLLFKKMQDFWKVYLVGFGVTCFIEIAQLFLKRGVFEQDDLLGNTVGVMIGYGLYRLGKYILNRVRYQKREKCGQMLLLQIPFLMAFAAFGTIFLVYYGKELGNLSCEYIIKQKNISVTSDMNFEEETTAVSVYKAKIFSVEETENCVRELFSKQGYSIDESRTDIYENTAFYYSKEGENRLSVWFYYDGGTFHYNDFERGFFDEENSVKVKTDATEEEVRGALENIGVFVPTGTVFENKGEGTYCFTADKVMLDDTMYDGEIDCVYYEDGSFGEINSQVMELNVYKEFEILSEKEAYEELVEGEFSYWRADEEMLNIQVQEIKLEYRLDTKGFYQPVYVFEADMNGWQGELIVPAIK